MPRSSRAAAARFSFTAALLCAAVPALPAQGTAAAPRGRLFIVGGGPQPAALVREFVDLAGGKHAEIIVFAMASSSGLTSGEEKASGITMPVLPARSRFDPRSGAVSLVSAPAPRAP